MQPIIEESQRAIDTLDKGLIAEAAQNKNPNQNQQLPFQATYILLSSKKDSKPIKWTECLQMMTGNFFERLKHFKSDELEWKVVTTLDKFVQANPDIQNAEKMQKASRAGALLGNWALAILKYAKVLKDAEPKRKQAEEMKQQLNAAEEALH